MAVLFQLNEETKDRLRVWGEKAHPWWSDVVVAAAVVSLARGWGRSQFKPGTHVGKF